MLRPMGQDMREETEARMRELVSSAGLPSPDEVEYGHQCIWLLWHEQKLVVQIDEIPVDRADREPPF